ncbi:2,3-bisphosphoglycerate-independent phosphoglycerate mutase 1 [uncultured archaeon]|nr:2,3-bisphosphoglycerate-independent phosphoglycerate mutase 1 [uncultured archaeon]
MAEKAVLLILDGLGDLPAPKLTPLQAARKPNMDTLAARGMQGLMSTIRRGVVPGSDTAHLQILGYEPEKYYCGRGPLEALGAGIELKEGDVAFRANFATVSGHEILDRRAGRLDSSAAKELEKDANMSIEGVRVIFKSTVEHRGVLVLRGHGLSANISPTDPHHAGTMHVCVPHDHSYEAKRTADIVNKFTAAARKRLENSGINAERKARGLPPANAVLLRGAGMHKNVIKFELMNGVTGACIAGGALYKGVARFLGMDVIDVPGATGTKNTDLRAKGLAAQKALLTHDFVFVHVKATDSFSHDGDAPGKTKFIEKVDKELIPILARTGAALLITGDHSTACVRKDHTGYEVPVLVFEDGGRSDGLRRFDEISAMKGGLGHVRGKDVMPIILNMIGKSKMYGS